jgi:signal peptidase II
MSESALATPETESAPQPVDQPSGVPERGDAVSDGPSYLFFGVVAAVSLLADVATKAWAEIVLTDPARSERSISIVGESLTFTLAYNRGGAWGLLQNASELVRRPFFVCVSLAAVVFIYSLYSRLLPGQRALKWGLPLVLGGALGNLADRIIRSSVVDFIDYRAEWIRSMNENIARLSASWNVTDHWPTFNVADIWICIGVGLMAVDMITSRREPEKPATSGG